MIRKGIARTIGFPFQDILTGTKIMKTLGFLKQSQFWEEERLYEYRLNKLRTLFEFARRNVPYYEETFRKLKLSKADIKSLDDISKIPILTKKIAREENMNLVARNFSLRNVKKGKTGGTTGAPIVVLKDIYNRSFTWASYYRWYEWMGINYYDKEATFWGAGTVLSDPYTAKIRNYLKNFSQNNLAVNTFEMNEEKMADIYRILVRSKPVIIKGYLSALIDLANFINLNSLEKITPGVISPTSETLLPRFRRYLEKSYSAPVFDQYGCGELSAISYECSMHNGLHINQEHIICEILNDSNIPVTGERGRVIGTDLDNLVMPFIRYENGDLATISEKKCTCGINQPLMSSIDGREIDTIITKDGSSVHGVFFTDILHELNIYTDKILRFQVYQNQPGIIEFRCEVREKLDRTTNEKLRTSLELFFSEVNIREVQRLDINKNGKFKYILNEIESPLYK